MNIRQVLRPGLQQQVAAAERMPQKKSAPTIAGRADRTSWSKQALDFIREQNRLAWQDPSEDKKKDPNLKRLENDLKTQDKCMKIFMRISKGDIVPPEDLNYLANTDPMAFMLAMAQRKEKPDPKKWKSVLDDEDREGAAEDSSDAAGETGGDGGEAVAAAAGSAGAGSSGMGASGGGGGSAGGDSGGL